VFDVTVDDVCKPGYAKKARAVPKSLRDQAYQSYGIAFQRRGDYQFDDLIPVSLAGSNSVRSLWPQSANTSAWNARTKDVPEARLRKLVCTGQLDLRTAQHAIASDWIKAYQRWYKLLFLHLAGHSDQSILIVQYDLKCGGNTQPAGVLA
jgi:hypothetical protein